eukprot:6369817-Alexandrium_andersonii.AAC.1
MRAEAEPQVRARSPFNGPEIALGIHAIVEAGHSVPNAAPLRASVSFLRARACIGATPAGRETLRSKAAFRASPSLPQAHACIGVVPAGREARGPVRRGSGCEEGSRPSGPDGGRYSVVPSIRHAPLPAPPIDSS